MLRYARTARIAATAVLFAVSVTLAQNAPSAAEQKVNDAIDKGLSYLKTQQKPDGGWQAEQQPPGVTAIVLHAFVDDSPTYTADTDFIKKGYDKLLSYQAEDGGIYKDAQTNYNTAIGISALAAANKPQYKPNIDKAVAYLKGLQWSDINESAET